MFNPQSTLTYQSPSSPSHVSLHSSSISHDLLKGVFKPGISEQDELRASRVAMAASIAVAGYFGFNPPDFAAGTVALAFGLAASSIFPALMMGIFSRTINKEGAIEIARRSRGTPRIANRILRRARDFAQIKSNGIIDIEVAKNSLNRLGIDVFGLDDMDRRILQTLVEKFNGGPVGLESLGVAISEDARTIEEVYEPYLIKEGFIQRTHRGRIAQAQAYHLLGRTITEKQQRLIK